MSTDRDRLLAIMRDGETFEQLADRLLAAGIKLPPEPPRLVTEDLLAPIWDDTASRMLQAGCLPTRWKDVPPSARPLSIDHANRVTESAIRRAVERKRDGIGRVIVQSYAGGDVWVMATSLLALFGLEAS